MNADVNENHGPDGRFSFGNGAGGSSGSKRSGKKKKSLRMTHKERKKVHDQINEWYYRRFDGKESCMIECHPNGENKPAYYYMFINYGFDNYDIYRKEGPIT